ncbi:fasciculation and elongation protein zeta-2 isoform X3 [Gadus macrocephalus]|uniref:fasciculation and elongation protein zeta-2 isoform X3 n=1 Tax=Gadus macrocephalus TaxID=80720 RepID=UPI0028CBBFDF|nr:fasciculation and elongation protein zeta-2 isoform X3 [Gadus macrocephalus]
MASPGPTAVMAAPLAHFEEDWQDFNEFQPSSFEAPDELDQVNSNASEAASGLDAHADAEHCFSGEFCGFETMEDLVQDFDAKLSVCFRNYNTATEHIAPIKPITEEHFLKDDEVWNALSGNYGNVMPVDWKTSHTRSLHLPTLNLRPHKALDNQSLDLSDDEELREQMDMHSIIVSCVNNEPLFTAEQVIEEIEEMMQESPDPEEDGSSIAYQSDLSNLSEDLQALKHSQSNSSYQDRLRQLSVCELTEALEEVESAIGRYSEELIQALALRDELDYEKEVKNSFISLIIDVQNRQKEQRELLRKRRKIRSTTTIGPNGQRTASTHVPGTYLTTVIPYEKKAGSPSVEDLQILTKILQAMRDDSEKVPSLLTDYILKVLCPT